MTDASLPIIEPPAGEHDGGSATVHGVVLAAGTSSRYGSKNKLLQPLDGAPVVWHATESFVASELAGVSVVLGYDRDQVRATLCEFDVSFRVNEAYDEGQSTSVRAGIAAAREASADAVVFGLGDMPAVAPRTIDTLLTCFERGDGSALAAGYRGARGNPVLFDSCHFNPLGSVDGDIGGREIFRTTADAAIVETNDPGVVRDIDSPSDLAKLRCRSTEWERQ